MQVLAKKVIMISFYTIFYFSQVLFRCDGLPAVLRVLRHLHRHRLRHHRRQDRRVLLPRLRAARVQCRSDHGDVRRRLRQGPAVLHRLGERH